MIPTEPVHIYVPGLVDLLWKPEQGPEALVSAFDAAHHVLERVLGAREKEDPK